jgi:hypothetical protein
MNNHRAEVVPLFFASNNDDKKLSKSNRRPLGLSICILSGEDRPFFLHRYVKISHFLIREQGRDKHIYKKNVIPKEIQILSNKELRK